MQVPKVTAIMAAFNAAGSIETAIRSVLAQTSPNFELVVVDDASTDATSQVAAGIDDARIRLIKLRANQGRARARNVGISESSGQYIAICDADDISEPSRFGTQEATLDSDSEVSVTSSSLRLFASAPDRPHGEMHFPSTPRGIDCQIQRGRMPVAHASAMFRRDWFEDLGGYSPDYRWCEDFDLVIRGYEFGRYRNVSESLLLYRQPKGGASWQYWRENEAWRRRAVREMQARSGGRFPARGSGGGLLEDTARFVVYKLRSQNH